MCCGVVVVLCVILCGVVWCGVLSCGVCGHLYPDHPRCFHRFPCFLLDPRKAFLTPEVRARKNLHVAPYSEVSRVLFEHDTATGVEFTNLTRWARWPCKNACCVHICQQQETRKSSHHTPHTQPHTHTHTHTHTHHTRAPHILFTPSKSMLLHKVFPGVLFPVQLRSMSMSLHPSFRPPICAMIELGLSCPEKETKSKTIMCNDAQKEQRSFFKKKDIRC